MNLILERVNNACNYVRDRADSTISFKKLIGSTRSSLRLFDLDVSLKTKKKLTLQQSEFYVLAFYDAYDDQHQETPIEVIVYHNFNNSNPFSTLQITDFLIQIFDATVHELRHRKQSVKRNYKTFNCYDQEPFKEYLKDPDELDAYSLSIAIEFLRVMDKQQIIRYMRKITIMSKLRHGPDLISPSLKSYIDNFGLDKTTKELAKKVYKHLNTIDKNQIFV